jgi:hypothetical protein
MVAPIETLKKKFPRAAEALKKHHALVDSMPLQAPDKQRLKASAVLIALVVGEEVVGIGKHIDLIRGLFGK